MKPLDDMKVRKLAVTFTEDYYTKFEAHCKKNGLTPEQMIGQLIAVELSPPNVVWGPWPGAA